MYQQKWSTIYAVLYMQHTLAANSMAAIWQIMKGLRPQQEQAMKETMARMNERLPPLCIIPCRMEIYKQTIVIATLIRENVHRMA